MILRFPQTHNPWIDAGIVGFDWFVRDETPADISLRLLADCLEIEGEEKAIKALLEKQFWRLVEVWYNASSAKQEEEKSGYFFDPQTKSFKRFSKSLPKGLAALLFDAAAQEYEGPSWYKSDKKDKSGMKESRLDPGEAREWAAKAGIEGDLQELLDQFLRESGLWPEGKPRPSSTTQAMLWGKKNLRVPKIILWADDSKPKGVCSISGESVAKVFDIDGKTFPFTVGKSGHVNFTPNWEGNEQVGWKTIYISLFTPVVGFWQGTTGNYLIGAIPVASDLASLKHTVSYLKSMVIDDSTLRGNFEVPLKALQYARKSEEYFVAFFHRIFQLTLQARDGKPPDDSSEYEEFMLPQEIDKGAPTAFLLIEAQKSQKWDIKHAEVYQDPIYLLRLFSRMYVRDPNIVEQNANGNDDTPDDDRHWRQVKIDPNRFLHQLRDPTQPAKGGQDVLTRRTVLRNILHKKQILPLLVSHAFSINRETNKTQSVSELLKFAEIYEPLFWRKDMIEDRDQFLKAAKKLGEHIAIVLHERDDGRKNRLYKLRRALKLQDFLREVNTLQERFELTVPEEIGTGLLGHHNFEEFRGFCLLNALNKFNQIKFAKSKNPEGV